MTIVKCKSYIQTVDEIRYCKYSKDGICQRDEINLDDDRECFYA